MERLSNLITKHPKWACFLAGVGTSFAFATHPIFPALALIGVLLILINGDITPKRAGFYTFLYAMGLFTAGLYWVQNALGITLPPALQLVRLFILFGLPLLLTPLWVLAANLSVRFTNAGTLARSVLFITLLAAAEYGRAFFLTGFPWNLFAYALADINPLIQVSALGGVFFLNTLTLFWAAAPTIIWIHRDYKKLVGGLAIGSLVLCLGYGIARLQSNPAEFSDDTGVVVVQPNVDQKEKWKSEKLRDIFYKHITLSENGLKEAEAKFPESMKSVAVLWPETAISDFLVFTEKEALTQIVKVMQDRRFKVPLITGLMREEGGDEEGRGATYYNSITALSQTNNALSMDDIYDKAHLVPFGEYMPMETYLSENYGIKPITGFIGFRAGGYGPKVLHAPNIPAFAALVCYETIFPWSIQAHDDKGDAQWIVNVSNDGWYGNTSGPHQHLAMTRFRAVEQGLPVLRSTSTGISAVIDSYGRVLQSLDYGVDGYILSALPKVAASQPPYRSWHETLFFTLIFLGLVLTVRLKRKRA